MVTPEPPRQPKPRSTADIIILDSADLEQVFERWHDAYDADPAGFVDLDEGETREYGVAAAQGFRQFAEGLTLNKGDLDDIASGFGVEFTGPELEELARYGRRLESQVALGNFTTDESDNGRPLPAEHPAGRLFAAIQTAKEALE